MFYYVPECSLPVHEKGTALDHTRRQVQKEGQEEATVESAAKNFHHVDRQGQSSQSRRHNGSQLRRPKELVKGRGMPKLFVIIQARRRCGASSSSIVAEESNAGRPIGEGRRINVVVKGKEFTRKSRKDRASNTASC
jgi:hypothetical protein